MANPETLLFIVVLIIAILGVVVSAAGMVNAIAEYRSNKRRDRELDREMEQFFKTMSENEDDGQ